MPTFDAVSNATPTTGTTVSWSHTIGSGSNRLLLVSAYLSDVASTIGTISTLTYDGVAMSPLPSPGPGVTIVGSQDHRCETWYMLDAALPVAGTYTIAVTISASALHFLGGVAVSLADSFQGAPEAVATATGSANNISTSVTTLTDNALIIDTVSTGVGGSADMIPGESGQTERLELIDSDDVAISTRVIAVAASSAMSWTGLAVPRVCHVLAVVAPATVGGQGVWIAAALALRDAFITARSDTITTARTTTAGAFSTSTGVYASPTTSTPLASELVLIRYGNQTTVDFGQEATDRDMYTLFLAFDADIATEDRVTVDSCFLDADLVGDVLIVTAVDQDSFNARKVAVCELAV